jgi:leucyl aminopeptidase (aminopeptidase T)
MSESSPELASKLARNVLEKTLRIRRGENVVIETWSESLPWARPFVAEARRMGANPLMLYEDEPSYWEAVEAGNARQTGRVGTHEWATLGHTNGYVFFFGPSEWPRSTGLPPRKSAGIAAYNQEWYRRAAKAKVRGARMYLGRVSQLAADRWQVDREAWEDDLLRGSLVPPAELHRTGSRIGARLRNGKQMKVTHPNGTELTFRLGKYPIQLDDALVDEADLKAGNTMAAVPGGVVGVSLDHTSAEGEVLGNHTTYPNTGPVTGAHWKFRDGRLVEQSYESGGDPLLADYSRPPRTGKDRLSYVSIGLNPELHLAPQMEDQELGALLLRIGGNRFAGGSNPAPFGTWLVLNGADVTLDGKPLLENGTLAGG